MPDHLLSWIAGVVAGCAATIAGVFSILFAAVGAVRRYPPERLGRLTLFGTLLGATIATLYLLGAVLIGVLS